MKIAKTKKKQKTYKNEKPTKIQELGLGGLIFKFGLKNRSFLKIQGSRAFQINCLKGYLCNFYVKLSPMAKMF